MPGIPTNFLFWRKSLDRLNGGGIHPDPEMAKITPKGVIRRPNNEPASGIIYTFVPLNRPVCQVLRLVGVRPVKWPQLQLRDYND